MKRLAIAAISMTLLLRLYAWAEDRPASQAPQAPQPAPQAQPAQTVQPAQPGSDAQAQAPAQQTEVIKKKSYTYKENGRRDPFLSIITAAKQAEEVKVKGATPLEEFDLSQIGLSAIIWSKSGYYALVGLPDGRHFTVRKGTRIGIHDGHVAAITQKTVVINQKVRDYRGRMQIEDYTLRLRSEGEE